MVPRHVLAELARRGAYHPRFLWRRGPLHSFEWDISGKCERPIRLPLTGRAEGKRTMIADLTVRCRRCDPCGRQRFMQWRERALNSEQRAFRTWFVTLTFRPAEHFKHEVRASRLYEERDSGKWANASEEVKFRHLSDMEYREVQKYWKRLRKAGCKIDYLTVVEKHEGSHDYEARPGVKSGANRGRPHFHALIHERPQRPGVVRNVRAMRHLLRSEWGNVSEGNGICDVQLARDARATSSYVAKYITKNPGCRVRASARFGNVDFLAARAAEFSGLAEPSEPSPVGGEKGAPSGDSPNANASGQNNTLEIENGKNASSSLPFSKSSKKGLPFFDDDFLTELGDRDAGSLPNGRLSARSDELPDARHRLSTCRERSVRQRRVCLQPSEKRALELSCELVAPSAGEQEPVPRQATQPGLVGHSCDCAGSSGCSGEAVAACARCLGGAEGGRPDQLPSPSG